MDEVYKRVNSIREKIEENSFLSIYNFFEKKSLKISKENFDLAIKELWKNNNKSYCKYVYFIKKYFYKKKLWK